MKLKSKRLLSALLALMVVFCLFVATQLFAHAVDLNKPPELLVPIEIVKRQLVIPTNPIPGPSPKDINISIVQVKG